MSKHHQNQQRPAEAYSARVEQKTGDANSSDRVRLPGDPLTPAEERRSQESTLAQIKREMDAEKAAAEARAQAMAVENRKHGVQVTLPGEVTAEMRAKSHADSVAFILSEFEEQNAANPPRPIGPQGGDQATVDMIKAEMAKSHKRIVLPSG